MQNTLHCKKTSHYFPSGYNRSKKTRHVRECRRRFENAGRLRVQHPSSNAERLHKFEHNGPNSNLANRLLFGYRSWRNRVHAPGWIQEQGRMTLNLTMLRCPDAVPPQTRTVAGGEFSIGRGAENDWVLPDPERFLGRRHCVLAYRSGGWQIADLSQNGTFLNGEAEAIRHGQPPRELRDRDRFPPRCNETGSPRH